MAASDSIEATSNTARFDNMVRAGDYCYLGNQSTIEGVVQLGDGVHITAMRRESRVRRALT